LKKAIWKTDAFAGVVVALAFAAVSALGLLEGVEEFAYDVGVRASTAEPGDSVAVIAIDDQSINNLGRWPWPRDVHAEMIDILNAGGAKVIGNTVFFLEPQIDPGLRHIAGIADYYANSSLFREIPGEVDLLRAMFDDLGDGEGVPEGVASTREFFSGSALARDLSDEVATLGTLLEQAMLALNTDLSLARSLEEAGNVVLAMPFWLGQPRGKPDEPLPDYVTENALPAVVDPGDAATAGRFPLPTYRATPPIETLGEPASAIGNLLVKGDADARREALVTLYYDTYYPSLALQVAAESLNLSSEDVEVRLGEGVRVGGLSISTDPRLQMYAFFYGDREGGPAFPVDSFYDVYTGNIPAEKYRDKVVLIGATAPGISLAQSTPVDPAMPPVVALAHTVASILNEDFFVFPEWAPWAELGAFVLVAVYLIVLLPRMRAGAAAGLTGALLIVLLGVHIGLMTTQAMWLQLMLPATFLIVGHLLITTKRFLMTEKGKIRSEAESAESNRMLGLAFQGQGQLDMAFEKFRKLPKDDTVADLLYNLALDYERKRQFNKAGSIYNYIADFAPGFRDVQARVSRSKAMEDTVLLGAGGGGGAAAGTLLLDGEGVQKPMLGRYQVEKELGKGAMGVVYLGRDPKINRVVAIKTMALSQEFEEDELDEVKERFFREAETAGRLNHPNIVTIYDAGEEHDLAYIAMEFLKGKDLTPSTRKEGLLPVGKALEVVAQAADALDYAHAQNVVHRDIKPANIMYEADEGKIKITDFGIARITDSSKTKTGMVLGTPSYMSPEQLAGKKVDGRSDIFSLGAMLYQLCTGALPFQGDSMATLMFKIANDEHPDPLTLRPDLPACVKAIIDKALQKAVEDRYQRAGEMAGDLRSCRESLAM